MKSLKQKADNFIYRSNSYEPIKVVWSNIPKEI